MKKPRAFIRPSRASRMRFQVIRVADGELMAASNDIRRAARLYAILTHHGRYAGEFVALDARRAA